ncbi:MAG: DegT/DnrJ/EryC1/StrS family aminotransferase, partial [bacterium]
MQIPVIDVKRQLTAIRQEIDSALNEVFESGQFILGPFVKKFEQEVCDYIRVSHSIGCASGTDALMLALMGIGIRPGDEVITTPFTFVATAEVIAFLGAKPVFVDINPNTFNIAPEKIETAVTENTKAILPVHLFGLCSDMDSINKVAEKYDLKVIEDCAQAFGAEYNGKKAGALSDAGCFSFYPTKNLNAFGDGGTVTVNSDSLAENIRTAASHGSKEKYTAVTVGVNSRLDALQAVCLSVKLKYID